MSWYSRLPPDINGLFTGGTRRGKSYKLQLISRSIINSALVGGTWIDPHGEMVRFLIEYTANPANGASQRVVHLCDFSSDSVFAINPLQNDGTWEGCHDAAGVLAAVVESRFDAPPEALPRLARIIYIAAMLCARHRLTLIELVECLSLGAEDLRRSLLSDFENRVVRGELEDLQTLALKNPARFLELVESAKNRFVRWLGDRRLARMLGQKTGLDPRLVMDGRELVFFDLSALNYSDAAFVGTLVTSMYFAAARKRPAMRCARHRLVLDEAESLITPDVARMTDQCAKFGLNIFAAIQRLGQVNAKGEFIRDALMVNCALKVVFGGLEPESARYVAELLFTPHLNYCEYKHGSERPIAVGNDVRQVRSSAHAEHRAEHESSSETESHSTSRSRSRSIGHATGVTEGVSVGSAHGTAIGVTDMDATAIGTSTGSVDTTSLAMTPDTGVLLPPTIIGQGSAQSLSTADSSVSSHAHAESRVSSHVSSESWSRAVSEIESEVVSESEGDTHGIAHSVGRGTSRGQSVTHGESEVFTTRYEWMPTAIYSPEEQLSRLTGELMSLPRRECVVAVEGARPFRMRTPDVTPAFRSAEFQAQMLPVFRRACNQRSAYTLSAAEADAAMNDRLAALTAPPPQPEAQFEPLPFDPSALAKEFWAKRTAPPAPKPQASRKKPRSRPVLTVISGDKTGDNPEDDPVQ